MAAHDLRVRARVRARVRVRVRIRVWVRVRVTPNPNPNLPVLCAQLLLRLAQPPVERDDLNRRRALEPCLVARALHLVRVRVGFRGRVRVRVRARVRVRVRVSFTAASTQPMSEV